MRPTDQEIAAMLARASWQVQGVGFQLDKPERDRLAQDMRELATLLSPTANHPSGPTTPTPRQYGAYTGD